MLASTSLITLLSASSFFGLGSAGYTLQDDYSGSNFFNMFNFFTGDDPTGGYVDFQSQAAAQSAQLINTNNGQVYMGVDHSNIASGRGRQSVRITSKATYNHALIVLDLAHMPGGTCGVWPAFWTLGSNWPTNGEIDIIEGVNSQSYNDMTLHTNSGCTMSSSTPYAGRMTTSNCDVNAAGQAANAGCQIQATGSQTYGTGFNSNGGGIYATEWTSTFIRIWYFSHSNAPSDIFSANPNPNNWGTPTAYFGNGGCDIETHFQNHNLVFDTTFCGSWAGNVWSSDSTCSSLANSCQAYVQNNPSAFQNAYWSINSLKVYTNGVSSRDFETPSANSSAVTVAPVAVPQSTPWTVSDVREAPTSFITRRVPIPEQSLTPISNERSVTETSPLVRDARLEKSSLEMLSPGRREMRGRRQTI